MFTSISHVAGALITGTIVYLLVQVVYRLTLHPLAKYPGPFLAKISPIYQIYYSYTKELGRDQYKCHQKYGPIVRYSPNYLIFNTDTALYDIYAGPKSMPVQKAGLYKYLHDGSVTSIHSVIDKDVHAFKRRVLSHGFSEQALRNVEEYMVRNIDKWLVHLGSDASSEKNGYSKDPKDIKSEANHLTFDVLGELCFGKSFGLLDSDEQRYVPPLLLHRAWILQLVGGSTFVDQYRWLASRIPLESMLFPTIAKSMDDLRAFAKDAMTRRLAFKDEEKQDKRDFVHYLTTAKDPVTGKGYSNIEFLQEARLLIVAGSDTSSITMAATFYYLTKYTEIQARLRKELREKFTSVEQIRTGTDLSSCHYLRAVIEESLRISPPVPSAMPREITAPGLEVDGQMLPPGTEVGVPIYAIHHNEAYFKDSHTYNPSRWLSEETSAEELATAKHAFCAFQIGNRGCLGRVMAYNELSIALGRVFWMYEVRRAEGSTLGDGPYGEYAWKDVFVCEREGPLVEFKKVEL